MTRLALGTVQFGLDYGIANRSGRVPVAEARAMVNLATASGVDTLDTAIGYGGSEATLGEIGVQGLRVVTKLPGLPSGATDVAAWIDGEIGASLSRLCVDRVYGLLLHRPSDLLGRHGEALLEALVGLKQRGIAERIGVSIYAPAELERLSTLGPLDLVQAPFNLVDRRLQTSGWLARLKDRGTEVHTRSAFLQGLLLLARDEIPRKFARWNAIWERWHGWLAGRPESAVAACLAFPLSFPEIDRVVVGADSAGQLRQLLAAAAAPLPDDLPDLASENDALINPSNWMTL